MKTLTSLTLVATMAAFGASAASDNAAPKPPADAASFKKADTNGDGKLTAEELAKRRAARFAARDTNGDGKLSAEELKAAALKRFMRQLDARIAHSMKRNDANGDGLLSPEEMPGAAKAARMIEFADTDGDGAVTARELRKARHKRLAFLRRQMMRMWQHGPKH